MIFISFLYALMIVCLCFPVYKVYQLNNYSIKKTLINVIKFRFANGDKNKLVLTNRMKRFICFNFIFNLLISLLCYIFIKKIYLYFIVNIIFVLFNLFIFSCVHFIMCPVEYIIKCRFIKRAQKKLLKLKCKKIGITGSFGKTSTKNILCQILEEEYKVCKTPKSYNTPMGICKTILEDLNEEHEFFIVEMGARREGDIAFFTNLVEVEYGIITSIGEQHIETFRTIENIEKTKFELCEFIDEDGVVIFNGKSSSSYKLYKKCKRKKYLLCRENSYAFASNISTNEHGSKFTLNIDKKKIDVETKLLGKLNIDNIVMSSTMAYLLGENLFNIKKAISKLKPIEHRLELIKGENVCVIDDSYNSNLSGAKEALQVLSNFKKRKIVITPGIVEMGSKQEKVNFDLGKEISKVADICIIMNKINKNSLKNGLKSGNFDEKMLFFANTREEQKNLLNKILLKNDVVLFENDLPDNYK